MAMIDPRHYVTVGHAAELADVSRHWMRLQAINGKISSVCIDGQWFILKKAAESFERHPSAGRPRAAKRARSR